MQTVEQTDGRTKQLATLVHPKIELAVRLDAAKHRQSISGWIREAVEEKLQAQGSEQEPS